MHHRLAMLLPPHPHPDSCHPRHHLRRHRWFLGPTYYALSSPHSALIHHRLAMFVPPHLLPHHRQPRPHSCRHHWFPGPSSRVHSRPVIAGRRSGWPYLHHLHVSNRRCPLACWHAVRHTCNCCLPGCLGKCFWSQGPQAPLRRSNSQEGENCQHALHPCWWPRQASGSPPVGSDGWLSQECFYTPYVSSSLGVCSRYSSRMYTCLQRQARLTTCNLLQRSRIHSFYHHSLSWIRWSDQVCPCSTLTWKLLDEHLGSFATPGEHGATWCR